MHDTFAHFMWVGRLLHTTDSSIHAFHMHATVLQYKSTIVVYLLITSRRASTLALKSL
jgi:hypothetical protein